MNTSKLKQKGQPKKANSLIIEESLTHNSREEPDTNFLQEDQGDWSGNRQCYICNQLVDAETELEFVCHISLCEATLADLAQISNYLDCNSTCEFQSIKLTPQKTLHRRAVSWSGSPSTKLYDEIVFAPETPETEKIQLERSLRYEMMMKSKLQQINAIQNMTGHTNSLKPSQTQENELKKESRIHKLLPNRIVRKLSNHVPAKSVSNPMNSGEATSCKQNGGSTQPAPSQTKIERAIPGRAVLRRSRSTNSHDLIRKFSLISCVPTRDFADQVLTKTQTSEDPSTQVSHFCTNSSASLHSSTEQDNTYTEMTEETPSGASKNTKSVRAVSIECSEGRYDSKNIASYGNSGKFIAQDDWISLDVIPIVHK